MLWLNCIHIKQGIELSLTTSRVRTIPDSIPARSEDPPSNCPFTERQRRGRRPHLLRIHEAERLISRMLSLFFLTDSARLNKGVRFFCFVDVVVQAQHHQ